MKTKKLYTLILLACVTALISSCATPRYKQYEPYPEKSYPKETVPETKHPDVSIPESKYIIASWYGADFHGKLTASGEPYNMHAKTCAHKEYAFGTRLRVTNTANSKTTECTVNDRGPFVQGRELDLSYTCAREIEIIGTGTGKVKIEYIDRDNRYIKYIKYSPSGGGSGPFTIQIGSFKDIANAVRLKQALDLKYKTVYTTAAEINNTSYYRVRIGKFKSKDDAYSLAKTLADEGYNTLITTYDERL